MNPNAREFVPKGFAPYVIPHPDIQVVDVGKLQRKLDFYKEICEAMNANNLQFQAECTKEADHYRRAYEGLKGEYSALQQHYVAMEKKKDAVYEVVTAMSSEKEQLQEENEHLQSINRKLAQNLYSANTKLTTVEESLDAALDEIVAAKQIAASLQARLFDTERVTDERCRALQEELAMAKEELESYSLDCKTKVGTMQDSVTVALQLFTERCQEAEERRSEAERLLVTIYNKASTHAQETVVLQKTLQSLLQVRYEENACAMKTLTDYQHRILNLQAIVGITSTLYVPPPTRPSRPIMNPETDYDDDDPTHDIWTMTVGNA